MYKYEMHQHVAGCSACAGVSVKDMVVGIRDDGFDGVVLTNHFYHGNTGINRRLDWQDFVRAYEESFLEAKEIGDRIGVDVLFGIEEGVGGGKEVLLYGITPQFLYDNPSLRDGGLEQISYLTHQVGGLVFQAHPFRVREYIDNPWQPLPVQYLDGIEVWNACNGDLENVRAVDLARETGLLTSAGSDSHVARFENRCGIEVPERITTEKDLTAVLRSKQYEIYLGD